MISVSWFFEVFQMFILCSIYYSMSQNTIGGWIKKICFFQSNSDQFALLEGSIYDKEVQIKSV